MLTISTSKLIICFMNYALLKEIIVHLKRGFKCPECQRRYANKSIGLAEINDEGINLRLSCSRCTTVVVANVSLVDVKKAKNTRKHRSVKVKANKFSSVTENDVLDVRNFLKGFDGSFKNLFKQK